MLSVSEARQRLLAALPVCEAERVGLSNSVSRVLAEDVAASIDSPRFDNSSMDGFAVKAADTAKASKTNPALLEVVGDAAAGFVIRQRVDAGQATRIMTGAPLPKGADAVIPVEDTDAAVAQADAQLPLSVNAFRPVGVGENVRPAGQDFRAGDLILKAGQRLRPQDVGMLAALGHAEVAVYKRPRVAVLSSGSELVSPGQDLEPGKIYDANSFSVAALVESCEADVLSLGIVHDDLQAVQTRLDEAATKDVDLILTSAGVSVGAFDYLRLAVEGNGALDFWKVNMRPGKPFAFGNYRGIPYVGLPGNPVSAFVGFEVFARPALQKMGGIPHWSRRSINLPLGEDIRSDGRESFLRARINEGIDEQQLILTGHQGSGNLYSLVQADGLMVVPAGVTEISTGTLVEFWPL